MKHITSLGASSPIGMPCHGCGLKSRGGGGRRPGAPVGGCQDGGRARRRGGGSIRQTAGPERVATGGWVSADPASAAVRGCKRPALLEKGKEQMGRLPPGQR